MTTPMNERLTAPPFHPHANERADYETRGTTLVEYLARRAAKTVILAPLRELLAVARPGGPLPAVALLYFAYYAVAASTSYGRGYQKPTPSTERSAVERDREQPALITARSIGARGDLTAEITAEVEGIGRFVSSERILATTVSLRGLGMAAPSQFSFESTPTIDTALIAWRAEARGTITTELAPSLWGTVARAYGQLILHDDAGNRGEAPLDRAGSVSITVSDSSGGVSTLTAPLK